MDPRCLPIACVSRVLVLSFSNFNKGFIMESCIDTIYNLIRPAYAQKNKLARVFIQKYNAGRIGALLVKLLFIVCAIGFSISSYAVPPKQVLESCQALKAVDKNIKFVELNGLFDQTEIDDCDYRYRVKAKGYSFYTTLCGVPQLFVADHREISLSEAINKSLVAEIEPMTLNSISTWYKIDFKNTSYLCIRSAYGENGWAASVSQYYFVENAFDASQPLKLYYYFFDKEFIDQVRARGWTNG